MQSICLPLIHTRMENKKNTKNSCRQHGPSRSSERNQSLAAWFRCEYLTAVESTFHPQMGYVVVNCRGSRPPKSGAATSPFLFLRLHPTHQCSYPSSRSSFTDLRPFNLQSRQLHFWAGCISSLQKSDRLKASRIPHIHSRTMRASFQSPC